MLAPPAALEFRIGEPFALAQEVDELHTAALEAGCLVDDAIIRQLDAEGVVAELVWLHPLLVIRAVSRLRQILHGLDPMIGHVVPCHRGERMPQQLRRDTIDAEVLHVALEGALRRGVRDHERDVDDAPLVEIALLRIAGLAPRRENEFHHRGLASFSSRKATPTGITLLLSMTTLPVSWTDSTVLRYCTGNPPGRGGCRAGPVAEPS